MQLLHSYGLLGKMERIIPEKASRDELMSFHSQDYLDFCEQISETKDQEKLSTYIDNKLKSNWSSLENEFGVQYDCPILPNMSDLIKWIAGGSLGKKIGSFLFVLFFEQIVLCNC